jgi:Arc/MetJ-type ribon-helix-helix transcriptional regulator
MAVLLTPEHEQRIQAIIHSGEFRSVDDVVEAALTALEQRAHPDFEETDAELEALLLQGLDSPELSDEKFWRDVNRGPARMLIEWTDELGDAGQDIYTLADGQPVNSGQ